MPWFFGAYQEQATGLSSEFARRGYEIFWMPRTTRVRLPPGKYTDWRAAFKQMRAKKSMRRPSKKEASMQKHITYLGFPDIPIPAAPGINGQGLSVRQLNRAAEMYELDAIVLLMDIGLLFLDDTHFDVPVTLWMPYHFEQPNYQGIVVSTFTGIAAMSDTARRVVEPLQPLVRTIPHFIDRADLNRIANVAERRAVGDEGGSARSALFNSTTWDRMFTREIDTIDDDTFLVVMQGGNYAPSDRKAWVASIHVFAKFQRANPSLKTHLWIHTLDSAMVETDQRHGDSTISVPRQGLSLRALLQQAGIPSNMYTLDENWHPRGLTTALKRNADVCLHTSKSEGFGMVAVECQALGTPVVTTNYTAMRDYTKFGIAVEPVGTFELVDGGYFAQIDVAGAARALEAIALGTADLAPLESVFAWVDTELSIETVASKWEALLSEAETRVSKQRRWTQADSFESRPFFTVVTSEYPEVAEWDTPWTLIHHADTKVDYSLTQRVFLKALEKGYCGIAFSAPTQNGRPVEIKAPPGGEHMLNTQVVVLVPTWILRQFQQQQAYVWTLVYSIMRSTGDERYALQLPPVLAKLPDTP